MHQNEPIKNRSPASSCLSFIKNTHNPERMSNIVPVNTHNDWIAIFCCGSQMSHWLAHIFSCNAENRKVKDSPTPEVLTANLARYIVWFHFLYPGEHIRKVLQNTSVRCAEQSENLELPARISAILSPVWPCKCLWLLFQTAGQAGYIPLSAYLLHRIFSCFHC